MRIIVSGAGYAGLVTAACLADMGHDVTCVDIDRDKIASLQAGRSPLFEPGLDELLDRNADRLRFVSDYEEAPAGAEAAFIVVGTPRFDDGRVDLSQVFAATDQLAARMADGAMVVVKSTVPVGTTRQVAARIESAGLRLHVGCNPEFLREGTAVDDFLAPDRVVIGTGSPEAEAIMRDVYAPQIAQGITFFFTTIESAELIKYASNAFLATKLSFINEIADLCEASGAVVEDVARGIGFDTRIGPSYLRAGPGFGGACLPKDTQALWHTSRDFGTGSRIVGAALDVNADRIPRMTGKIAAAVGGELRGRRIAVLGITFKADTDDIRESPAVEIVRELVAGGATVRLFDPHGLGTAKAVLPPSVEFATDEYDAMTGADCLVIATEWSQFGELDLGRVREQLSGDVVVDLRNLYDPSRVRDAGIGYVSIGR
ncbi:MAG TPA: UDP-glucose/GDP-mannose dehydrogenase family protein [Acidimicrobiia bacterium]|nr:UDP-glucose/GDP-mannose dehydrogenase family protein [Acidimicrobiia bacterium]